VVAYNFPSSNEEKIQIPEEQAIPNGNVANVEGRTELFFRDPPDDAVNTAEESLHCYSYKQVKPKKSQNQTRLSDMDILNTCIRNNSTWRTD
jgi:hypothetical protein